MSQISQNKYKYILKLPVYLNHYAGSRGHFIFRKEGKFSDNDILAKYIQMRKKQHFYMFGKYVYYIKKEEKNKKYTTYIHIYFSPCSKI